MSGRSDASKRGERKEEEEDFHLNTFCTDFFLFVAWCISQKENRMSRKVKIIELSSESEAENECNVTIERISRIEITDDDDDDVQIIDDAIAVAKIENLGLCILIIELDPFNVINR